MNTSTPSRSNTTASPGLTALSKSALSTKSAPGTTTNTNMDQHQFLRSRRSIRKFQPRPVDADVLTRLLETATHAPSAHNRQPWRFAVLTHPGPKSRLSDLLAADFRRDLAADGLPEPEIEARLQR
ncbi:MAG: nitroreductase family protein, partial [Chloroflexi bacterium]